MDVIENALVCLLLVILAFSVLWALSKRGFVPGLRDWKQWRCLGPRYLLCTAVVIVVLHMAWVSAMPGSYLRDEIQRVLRGPSSRRPVQVYRATDEAFGLYAEKGNVVLRFPNADLTDHRQADMIQFLYFRSVYSVYPLRVYCGNTNDLINYPEDITKTGFAPSDEWLAAHNVTALVAYRVDETLARTQPMAPLNPQITVSSVFRDQTGRVVRGPEAPAPDPAARASALQQNRLGYNATSLALAVSYVSLVLALGYSILSVICGSGRCSLIGAFGLSTALGLGNMGLILCFASLAGLRPSRGILACVAAAVAALLLIQWRSGRLLRVELPTRRVCVRDWPLLLLVGLLLYLSIGISLQAIVFGWLDWDGFAIWGLKAKVLTHQSLRAHPAYFYDASLSFSHPDYPLLLPFLTSGFYAALGHVDAHLDKITGPLMFAALGAITYFGLRWKLPRNKSFWLTCALLALPSSVRYAGSGGADVPLTLFYGASIFFLVKWLEEGARVDLVLAALFTVYAALTKNEGQALALISAAVLWMFLILGRDWRRLPSGVAFVAGVLLLLLPWLLWSRGLPRTVDMSPAKLLSSLPNFWIALRATLLELSHPRNWGALWWLLVLAACVGWKAFRAPRVLMLWVLLLAHVALYVAVYTVQIGDLPKVWSFSLERIPLHATPAAIYLIGYHWAYLSETAAAQDAKL